VRNADFGRLWTANTVSALGTWLLVIAVPVHVYAVTGSALATSMALAIEAAPAMLAGPWAGVFVDRWDRRAVMAAASVCSAGGIALLLIGGLAFVYFGLLAESVAAVFLGPAGRALLPAIVGTGKGLAQANALNAFTFGVIRVTGPMAGVMTYVQGGLKLVVVLDMASYLVAAAAVMTIRRRAVARERLRRNVAGELAEGVRYLRKSVLTRTLLMTSWVFWTGNAGLTALLVPFVVHRLGLDGSQLGYLITGLGVGCLVGAVVSRPLLSLAPRMTLVVAGTATGLCFLVMFNASTLPVAVIAAFASGVPGTVLATTIQHAVQVNVVNELLGRVGAAFAVSDAAAALLGALFAAALVPVFGLAVTLNVFSAAVLLTGVSALAVPAPSIAVHADRSG
jgi:MFS family permease